MKGRKLPFLPKTLETGTIFASLSLQINAGKVNQCGTTAEKAGNLKEGLFCVDRWAFFCLEIQ